MPTKLKLNIHFTISHKRDNNIVFLDVVLHNCLILKSQPVSKLKYRAIVTKCKPLLHYKKKIKCDNIELFGHNC